MARSTEYKRGRSTFWMVLNENDDESISLSVSQRVSEIVKHHFPELEEASPKGWRGGRNNTENVWIPQDRVDQIDVDKIKQWAEFAGNQCVWLRLGNLLQTHFDGDEIDFCVASDFNLAVDELGKFARTPLGDAEYRLKYRSGELSTQEKQKHGRLLAQALLVSFDLLPLSDAETPTGAIVSPIPAEKGKSLLAWACAKYVAENKGLPLIEPRLQIAKPAMKELPIDQKVRTWENIYQTDNAVALDPQLVGGKDVIVVDDLYQSGTTMWAYARALRTMKARRIFGLVCVKSMRDSDNQ